MADAYERGVTHLKRGEYAAAVAAFSEAISREPERAAAYSGRALAYRALEDEESALRDEERVRFLGGVSKPRSEMTLLLTPEPEMGLRVDHEAFLHFFSAVDAAVREVADAAPLSGGHELQLSCALLPGGALLLEVQARPEDVPAEVIDGLRRRIESLARPAVRRGPVAFCRRVLLNGGCPGEVVFAAPFTTITGTSEVGLLDDALMRAAGHACAPPSWWRRLTRALGLGR